MVTSVTSYYVAFAAIIVFLVSRWLTRRRTPLPPGPNGLPFIGNPAELNRDFPWLHLAHHKDIYGPISSVTAFGQTYVILNSAEVADVLLSGRSAIYSERPTYNFACLCGEGNLLGFLGTGRKLKAYRKAVQQSFGSKNSIRSISPILEDETRRFLARILTAPGELPSCLKFYAAALILKVTYGYTMETNHPDPLLREVDEFTDIFALSMKPGAWLVDTLPLLRHLPTWMPGSGFKQTAKVWRKHVLKTAEHPYLFAKQQVAIGTARPSYISTVLGQSQDEPDEFHDNVFKWSAAGMYGAASETSVSLLHSYFLAMLLYPEVQRKAQAEIDSVVGLNRFPNLSDRDKLPYVNAVVKEALRWHSNVPLGLPHAVKEDDIYEGYFIPKGAIILPNVWLYNHDPSIDHDPFTFKPERFLAVDGSEAEMDPNDTVFGFGRRVCLGKKLANASIFHVVAMSLATLDVGKAHDANGMEISPEYEATQKGILSHTKPFPYSITARSSRAQELVMSINDECNIVHSDAATIEAISLSFMDER